LIATRLGQALLSLAAGAALALAFAPWNLWPLAILAPAVLFALWRDVAPRRAAWLGFCFAFGLFALGTWWLYVSIRIFGQAPLWLALLLMLGLVCIMALYHALLGWVVARWLPTRGWLAMLVALPAAWALIEWWRSWFLSGFGWLAFGYSQTDTWLAGFAPLGGTHLVSWLLLVMAGGCVLLWRGTRRERVFAALVLALPWPAGALLQRVEWTREDGAAVEVAVLQGAVPQDLKWLATNRDTTLDLYGGLAREAMGTPLIVMPEAALPDLANNLLPFLRRLAADAGESGSSLVLGILRAEPGASGELEYFNSVLALGENVAWYDKHHLVPFSEFFPVPAFVRSWLRLMSLPYSDFTRGARVQPTLPAAGLRLAASICYEDAYPATQRAAVLASTALVNVTNDAWFGRSSARYQHLQISRFRALESRRWLIRAANDGVSAVLAPDGRVVASAPEYQRALLRASVTPRTGSTPWLVVGHWPVVVICAIMTAVAAWRRRCDVRRAKAELSAPRRV
jgi:apolipoprotein N-acyltransferase